MQIADTKSEPAIKSRNRSTRVELSLRREQVYILLAKRYKAHQIHLTLQKRFPSITINKVYDDIQHVKRHPEGYRILEYIPNIREQCEWGQRQIDSAIRGALNIYHQGPQRRRTLSYRNGTRIEEVTTTDRNLKALMFVLKASMVKLNLGFSDPVTVKKIMSEYERLKSVQNEIVDRCSEPGLFQKGIC